MTILVALGLAGACSKDEKKAEPATAKPADPGTPADKPGDKPTEAAKPAATGTAATSDPTAEVGITAGGVTRDKEGSAGAITAVEGTVEVRRLGETTYKVVAVDAPVFAGDMIRTADNATTRVTLLDESVIEVAETSAVALASRDGSADPASSAAVLSGVARFTVSPRAPGEGAFRVYTPTGLALAEGATFGVGVAASGEARFGVETGGLDVIGLVALDAKPVTVDGGASITLAANGELASPSPWPNDDWGTWRDNADAKLEVGATFDAHADALAKLSAELDGAYADLDATADSFAKFEASAAASASAKDTAAYEASLPDGAATIDASFAVAGRLELLTWAYAAHAQLATDLYVRHPAALEARWNVVAPRIDAAVLWPKRYEVTAVGYLEPLRMQYYVHHPRGRVHAPLVGITVPAFYAQVTPPAIDVGRVRGRVKTKVWAAPDVEFGASTHPVWIAAPSVDWRANVKVAPAALRGGGSFYVRPPSLKAKVLVGANVTGAWKSRLTVAAPQPRAQLRAAWSIPVGAKIVVAPPDLS
ncbi:MAG TPA: FecR family protein, partial [Kofleriaceae bacterium]|nr:FecR family protein [Kofleriaceae bacterium]